jgi:hypothetical protein
MRAQLMILPLLLCAAPAVAQTAPAPALQVPPQLNDPATADRLARALQALSKAFLNLPAGEVEAALEGRQPTAKEKKMTVRDMGRADNPNFDRDMQQQMANARPMIEQSMKALSSALPAMMQGMGQMQQSLERAISNMPDPTYPKR